MITDSNRRVITLLALLGLLVSAARLAPYVHLPKREEQPPRVELAHDMELYELSLMQGSSMSFLAYRSVNGICDDSTGDPKIARACDLFDQALHNDSDRQVIDQAIDLLRDG